VRLYGYWRSSSSWRVRIGLAVKGLEYTAVPVHLVHNEQQSPAHTRKNPMQQVPVLELADGRVLSQSLAILGYLDAVYPTPALLPADPFDRAVAMALAEDVNSGTQPLQNLAIVRWGVRRFDADKVLWMRTWIQKGLDAMEARAQQHDTGGPWLVGDAPSLAEICLVPQLYNARRWGCDTSQWPTLLRADAAAMVQAAFSAAHPDKQPDAVPPSPS
jgi:maleylpyruvate isomerase